MVTRGVKRSGIRYDASSPSHLLDFPPSLSSILETASRKTRWCRDIHHFLSDILLIVGFNLTGTFWMRQEFAGAGKKSL